MVASWPTCSEDGCSGARTGGGTRCLAHAGADERGATLKRFSEGEELDVRGVTISDVLFGEIVDAAPHDADGHLAFSAARFAGATFQGDADFAEATFKGDARFGGATFQADARFGGATFKGGARFAGTTFESNVGFAGATFKGDARFAEGDTGLSGTTFESDVRFAEADTGLSGTTFEGATFQGDARFEGATFKYDVRFAGATFKGDAGFAEATFKSSAWFTEATFKSGARFAEATFKGYDADFTEATLEGHADFTEAIFESYAWFAGATFKGDADFAGATFKGDADFAGATFKGDVRFAGATFKGDVPVLGPVTVGGRLDLDGAQFVSPVRIEADASALTCRRGRFPGGVRFDVRRALIRLDDTDLSVPSLLTGPAVAASDPAGSTGQPRLLSLQRANVPGLALGNVDLADCRFAGAHNLDKLRLEAGAVFGLSPAVAGWERRQVIAEEAAWRAARARPGRWSDPEWPDSDDKPNVLSPGAVAVLYRALRKSREDAKDEPGAADFYYGEMEMRRHDRGEGHASGGRSRGLVSRAVLTAYWLVSGYGLRAWRSLAALAAVMAVSAGVFRLWGFTHSTSYWKSLLFAFRSTVSLTDAQVNLTAWGGLFQALLRLTGPVLLALTLLALRGRVKR